MKQLQFWQVGLVATVTTCAFVMAAIPTTTSAAELKFEKCHINVGAVEVDAECSVLARPENPAKPNEDFIELFVAKFPARAAKPEVDAFTLIQGGPGGSSIDMAIGMLPVLESIRANRDVLIVDQRGTGRSNKLACPELDNDDIFRFDPVVAANYAKECLAKNKDADLRFYTTSIAVQDLDAVREAAGYEQLTLYGVSYGTRVAQHYLRRFPEQTRAIIIDGVANVGLNLAGGEIARQSQSAFDEMANRCTSDEGCRTRFGDIRSKFKTLRERLLNEPQNVALANPKTGKIQTETVNEQNLYASVRMLPYSTEGIALMPLMISEAYDGNYIPLTAQTLMIYESFSEGFAMGMQNSVVCAEDYPFIKATDTQNLDDTYFGSTTIDAINIACSHWPRGVMDEDFHQPFDSSKPVLILSGETDPITPTSNGEVAAGMFSNSKHIIVPAHGHGVIQRGCVPGLVRDFVKETDLAKLNTKCIERERSMPFFVDSTGPKP